MDRTVVIGGEVSIVSITDGHADLNVNIDGVSGTHSMIDGEISLVSEIDGQADLNVNIDGVSGVVLVYEAGAHSKYTGEYTVTPKVTQQVLETADKLLTDDLTIKAIPYFETSNISDGYTVYIGSEVE